jgi:hypothetical protein
MEPARMERAVKPDAGKARAVKIVRPKDKVEAAVDAARVRAAAGAADKAWAKVAVVAVDADEIVKTARNDVFLPVTN